MKCKRKRYLPLGLAKHTAQPGYIQYGLKLHKNEAMGHHHIDQFSMPVKKAQLNLELKKPLMMNTQIIPNINLHYSKLLLGLFLQL
jgi:hypothetical protein